MLSHYFPSLGLLIMVNAILDASHTITRDNDLLICTYYGLYLTKRYYHA